MTILKKVFKFFKKIFNGKKASSSRKRNARAIRRNRPRYQSKKKYSRPRKKQSTRKRHLKKRVSVKKLSSKPVSVKRKVNIKAPPATINTPGVARLKSNGKPVAPKLPPKNSAVLVGDMTHFFSRIQVCVLKMKGEIKVGDKILIKGKSHSFQQPVRSLQIESVDVQAARRGQLVGLKLDQPANVGDQVFRL